MAEKDKTHGFSIRLLKEESNNVNIKSLLKIGNAEIVDNSTLPTDKKGYRCIEDSNKVYHYRIADKYDAYLKKRGNREDIANYKNSAFYVNAIKEARKYEKSHEKLIIIAGGCQSSYEDLIKAGANFASSPKRINIHALDPAIIAVKMSMSNINKAKTLATAFLWSNLSL